MKIKNLGLLWLFQPLGERTRDGRSLSPSLYIMLPYKQISLLLKNYEIIYKINIVFQKYENIQ